MIRLTDDLIREWECIAARRLEDGSICTLRPFIHTVGVCYDVDETGYGGRFCFPDLLTATTAYMEYTGGADEVPEDCIKPKGRMKKQPPDDQPELWPDDWGQEVK